MHDVYWNAQYASYGYALYIIMESAGSLITDHRLD